MAAELIWIATTIWIMDQWCDLAYLLQNDWPVGWFETQNHQFSGAVVLLRTVNPSQKQCNMFRWLDWTLQGLEWGLLPSESIVHVLSFWELPTPTLKPKHHPNGPMTMLFASNAMSVSCWLNPHFVWLHHHALWYPCLEGNHWCSNPQLL